MRRPSDTPRTRPLKGGCRGRYSEPLALATDSPRLEASLQVAPEWSPGLDVGEIGSSVRTRPEELRPFATSKPGSTDEVVGLSVP